MTEAGVLGGILRDAGSAAAESTAAAWLAGGAIRDALLGLEVLDVDLAVDAGGDVSRFVDSLAARPGWSLAARYARFGTATLTAPGGMRVDVAATRREVYPAPASLPVVTVGAPIGEDLGRRDFTIHAMARRIGEDGVLGLLLDPFGGCEDAGTKTLRLLHDASLRDDPTRALRAARYAARLGFGLEPAFGARLGAARAAGAFERLSGDRFRRGLEEILLEESCAAGVRLLVSLGLLDDAVPGWSAAGPDPAAVAAANGPLGRWQALLAPLRPGDRSRVAERLRFPKRLRRAAGAAVGRP